MPDVSKKYREKKLSKLGELLKARGISQSEFIDMLHEKYPQNFYSKSSISLHVNGKRDFMTTGTAKAFARTLGVTMEEIC